MGELSWKDWEGKEMIINFVGNFQNNYVGELGDATHLAREIEALGHIVRKIPQDEWREHVLDGKPYPNVPADLKADINIILKWHHFYDGRFIGELKRESKAPLFYWVWDYMQNEDWHMKAVEACDLYLGNDVRSGLYKDKAYYFPFDVADGDIPIVKATNQDIDVAFFGSWIDQGDRQKYLTELNRTTPIVAFSWNYTQWPAEFHVKPPVYGEEFNQVVARSKIVLGFSVEPNAWGYWSNRVGKTLVAGGFLLYQYAPGMELFLRDGVEYFSSIEEAREKIDHYLIAEDERNEIAKRGFQIGQHRFSSRERVKDLMILIERYLKGHDGWKY